MLGVAQRCRSVGEQQRWVCFPIQHWALSYVFLNTALAIHRLNGSAGGAQRCRSVGERQRWVCFPIQHRAFSYVFLNAALAAHRLNGSAGGRPALPLSR